MDLKTFLQSNVALPPRPRRRRHSIADLRFVYNLHDIPERPEEEEEVEKEPRRRSTGSCAKNERDRSASDPPDNRSPKDCDSAVINISGNPSTDFSVSSSELTKNTSREANEIEAFPSGNEDRGAAFQRCYKRSSSVDEDVVKEAVSTYVLSYTDEDGNVISADEVSPSNTGSSSPSDEDLGMSEMLRKVEAQSPMTMTQSRRGSAIDQDVVERITCLTPIVESSRSSSLASVVANVNGRENSPENCNKNERAILGSSNISPKNFDKNQEMLERIIKSPNLTRRGSISEVLNSLSAQAELGSDPARQNTKENGCENSAGDCNKNEGAFQGSNSTSPKASDKNQEILERIIKSPNLTRRGSLSEVLCSLSPQFDLSTDPARQNTRKGPSSHFEKDSNFRAQNDKPEKLINPLSKGSNVMLSQQSPEQKKGPWSPLSPLKVNAEHYQQSKLQEKCDVSGTSPKGVDKEKVILSMPENGAECDLPNKDKDKDSLLGRIIKSPCLTRRGSIGNVLNVLSPSPMRKCPSPSPFITKYNAEDVCSDSTKAQDVKQSSGAPKPKGLLAIVQKHVLNHTQKIQRKRRNSIASTSPHTGALEISLRDSFDTEMNYSTVKSTLSASQNNSKQFSNQISNSKSSSTYKQQNGQLRTQINSQKDIKQIIGNDASVANSNLSTPTDNSSENSNNRGNRNQNNEQLNAKITNHRDAKQKIDSNSLYTKSAISSTSNSFLSDGNNNSSSDRQHNEQLNARNTKHEKVKHTSNTNSSFVMSTAAAPPNDTSLRDYSNRSNSRNQQNEQLNVEGSPFGRGENNVSTPTPAAYGAHTESPQTRYINGLLSSTSRRLVGCESIDVAGLQSDLASVKPAQRKISAPAAPEGFDSPQRKTSVNIIKRAPITFVISNKKDEETGVRENGSECPMDRGVSFTNSRFLPISQKEAKENSLMKEEEASNLSNKTVNSTVTMSSRVTVHGGGGTTVRKTGVAGTQNPLYDSLPTDERFAALSERYASLKAKLGGSDSRQKNQDSSPKESPKAVESKDHSSNIGETSTQLKCWTTVESIPIGEYQDNTFGRGVDEACTEGKRKVIESDSEQKRIYFTENVNENDATPWRNIVNIYDTESDVKMDENNNVSRNTYPPVSEMEKEKGGIPSSERTALQRARTSVVAKLMDRKMGIRRKQSIVPRVTERRSKVYKEYCTADSGIPATVAQFEKIRTVVEQTVLRAPVRQEALTIQDLLSGLSSSFTEIELTAVGKECCKTLRTLDALGSLPCYVSLETVIINPSGTIKFKHLSTGISIDDLYLAPEYSNKFSSEKTCVFSLAATLWSAADWRLTEAEKPSLSTRFQELLVSMTDDCPDARPGLNDVLQTCESLQTGGDMTSRERCQALLWEYQASAAMDNEDATKRKTLQEDKKHHDTLMGSISVAASFKGFLKKTTKPEERNPFVKAQNNQEHSNKTDGKPVEKLSSNRTVFKSEREEKEKAAVVTNSRELKSTSNSSVSPNTEKKTPLLDTFGSDSDENNNTNDGRNRKRGYSLTEDQKEQLLSLLATAKLNQKSPVLENNGDTSEEANSQKRKGTEEHPIKPPSPSTYAYPQYAQTEPQMMFSPITPAGRSASPSVRSDSGDSQIPAVPNFVPIAVPIPSVAPVPMSPFWYMPQRGMMPYPQSTMSPMHFGQMDTSVPSNMSVSTDSDVSEVSDLDLQSKNSSYIRTANSSSYSDKERVRRSSGNKESKLPRPIWQTPIRRSRATPVEPQASCNFGQRKTQIPDEFTERNEEVKQVRARTPSPSFGRKRSPVAKTPVRSQTPPVYWTRDGVNVSANRISKRQSTGSFPDWRSSSSSSSPEVRRRSVSSPSTPRTDNPVQRPRSSSSRPSSPAGSRSNSPVSLLVSKFEEMSQQNLDNAPRVRSDSVSSMISKFGHSSLVPEDRIVKGQFKPNTSAPVPQSVSKTGPFRPATRDAPTVNSCSSGERGLSSHERTRVSESSNGHKLSGNKNLADPPDMHRSGSDPGSRESRGETPLSRENRRRLSSSLGNIRKACETSDERYQDSRKRLLETVRKWSSQENIMRDNSSDDLKKGVQEWCKTGQSQVDGYSTKKEIQCKEIGTNTRNTSGNSSSRLGRPLSSELNTELIIKSNISHGVSKPLWTKDGMTLDHGRISSLDSEPVRDKGSPKSRPKNICIAPERDPSMQYYGIKSPKDFIWSPTSDTQKFEIPVDLAILESATPSVSSPLSSACGFDVSYGRWDGEVLSPAAPLSPGSLKDFKPSNYFTSVTFKCGEMEPERDTNSSPTRASGGTVNFDSVSNRRDPNLNYVRRLERKILRSTGDIEEQVFSSNSGSSGAQSGTSKDAVAVRSAQQRSYSETGGPKKVVKGNPNSTMSKHVQTSNHSSSLGSNIVSTGDSKNPRTQTRNDLIVRSRHPSGNGPPKKGSNPTSTNTPSSGANEEKTSNSKPWTSTRRSSLPFSQAINLSSNGDASGNPKITKSSSQTNLSPNNPKMNHVRKSSSQANLSTGKGPSLISSSKEPALSQGSGSGLTVSKHPYSKGTETKSKSSTTPGKPSISHPSHDAHVSKEHSKERYSGSSSVNTRSVKTNVTSVASRNSDSGTVRYPYTRRGSTPSKGNSTIKPPAQKSASNPASPLDPKDKNVTFEFFGPSNANSSYKSNRLVSSVSPNNEQAKLKSKQKPKQKTPSREGSSTGSSGVESSPLTSPSGSFSKPNTNFLSPSSGQSPELQAGSEDSGIFYLPSSSETLAKDKSSSSKVTTKRFPSNSSTDSGLNMSDYEETRKGRESRIVNKTNYVSSPPTSPTSFSPLHSPTSPKFPISSGFFYYPKDEQTTSSPKCSDEHKELAALTNLSSSSKQGDVSVQSRKSSAKSNESTNKTLRNDSDKMKNGKGGVSKIQDRTSLDKSEKLSSLSEKPKDETAVLKAAALTQIVKSSSKDRSAYSTPSPDILGRPSCKSPSPSSRVDSKELLGQLVKKVLNSAAAKQSSSPKASFAESTSSSPRTSDKENRAAEAKLFFLPEETLDGEVKEKTNQQGKSQKSERSRSEQRTVTVDNTSKKKEQILKVSQHPAPSGNGDNASVQSQPVVLNEGQITPNSISKAEEQLSPSEGKDALSKIIDMIHDEFAFDGYLDDGVEDVNMAEYVMSLSGMSEDNFKEAVTDQYSDLYWDEDLLHEMYEVVTGGQKIRRTTLQFSESTVSDNSPPESVNLSREESYLSLEPLYFNSISRSSSERSGTGMRDVLVSPLGEATEFLPLKVIAPEMVADIHELLTPIFEDYHSVMGIKLASTVEDLSDKLGTKIMEISQQLMLERRAKKKSMNSYNKMADVDIKKDVKDLASKLVNEIEESDKKIVYLKHVQRQLRNVYAERFGVDTSLLYAFVVSYNKSCVTLDPEFNNSLLNFSPIWNQRANESADIVDESFIGPSLQSGSKLGLFSYLFDRHAMSQAYVRYFLCTYRYIATAQELFSFIREKCSASLRTDSSGQVYNHQLQIRYRALDLLSEWIDGYYQFDFKTNPNLIKELLAFVKDELILVDRSERGHYLIELIAEKQKQDLNNNSLTEEPTDCVAVLQLEDPQALGVIEGKKDSLKKPSSSRKARSPVQCFRRATPEKETTYKATLCLKALSVLDHSSRILAEQLTLIQQDLFFRIHPIHFLNSRAYGIGVGRSQSPSRERDNIFGFSTGSRRISELTGSDQGPLPWEQSLYVSEPSSDGSLEELLEHAQDVSLWVAVEICSTSSVKAQLALITKFVNAARYCCEIRNYSTCMQIIDALEMFVVRHLPVWKQVPTKTTEVLEELKAVKVLLKTDSSWLMKSEASREKPTIPCFLLFIIHVQQQELGGFMLPSDMYKWTKMRSVARLVDQLRLFKQMRYAFQVDEDLKARLKQRIRESKNENLHTLASENASNFHLSSSHGSRKFHDAFKKMKATFGGHGS